MTSIVDLVQVHLLPPPLHPLPPSDLCSLRSTVDDEDKHRRLSFRSSSLVTIVVVASHRLFVVATRRLSVSLSRYLSRSTVVLCRGPLYLSRLISQTLIKHLSKT